MVLYVLYLYSDNTHKDKTVTWTEDTILAATDTNPAADVSTEAVDKAAGDSTTAADSAELIATVEKKDKKSTKKLNKKDRNKTINEPIKEAEELPGIREVPAAEELPGLDKEQIIHQQNQVIKTSL